MSARISQRIGGSYLTMGPLGWMIYSVVVLPFVLMWFMVVWTVKAIAYVVRYITAAVRSYRRKRAHRDAEREV